MRIRAKAAVAAREASARPGLPKMRGSFYKERRAVRGGGEAGSKTNELAEAERSGAEAPISRGTEVVTALGSTNTTAPVTTGSLGWQHAMLQSMAAFCRCWSQPAIGMSLVELASLELFLGACPCSGHIAPSQQPTPAACNAEAQAGAQSRINATRHTHAPSLLPGALESWCIFFIFPNPQHTPPATARKFNSPGSTRHRI